MSAFQDLTDQIKELNVLVDTQEAPDPVASRDGNADRSWEYGRAPWVAQWISRSPRIPPRIEASLVDAAKHDREKRDQVLSAFARQVYSEVRKRVHPDEERPSVGFDDLFQEGILGLCDAISHYKYKGARFGAYSIFWVRQRILLSYKTKHMVGLPHKLNTTIRSVTERIQVLDQKLGRSALMHELLALEDSEESVLEALSSEDHQERTITLDEVEARGMEAVWVSEVQSRAIVPRHCYQSAVVREEERRAGKQKSFEPRYTTRTPENEYLNKELREILESAFNRALTQRESMILSHYFGLGNREPMTLEQIGQKIDLTRERVRQIKEKALMKLRRTSANKELRSHMQSLASQTDDLW